MKLSERVEKMQFSPIRRFNEYALEAERNGKKIYRLNIGQPDVETPECFLEAIKSINLDVIEYAESGGVEDLQKAIIDYFRIYNIYYEKKDIMVTAGGSEALNMLFTTILDPGDEVLIAEPFYTNYHTFIAAANGKVVPVTTSAEEGYHYADVDKLEAAVTDKTKAILITNPGNPTGTILTKDEMQLIIDFAINHDLWIIADEVYREFAYDGRKVYSFGMFEECKNRLIIVDSISKRFSACGARVGCLVTKNEDVAQGVMKLAQGRLCVATLDQIGAAALYRLDKSYYKEIRTVYEKRRDAVYEEIMKIPGVICKKPGGSFYIMVKLPVDNVENFLMFLLKEYSDNNETVMFSPAGGFYATKGLGRDELRIAYVLNEDSLRRGIQILAGGLKAYKEKED